MVVLCFIASISFSGAQAQSDDEQDLAFVVKPQRCVTLREGQPCYVKLSLSWNSVRPMSLCVFGTGEKPLNCWTNVSEGEFFATRYLVETTRYTLKDEEGVEWGESTVVVAWVYKSRRTRKRWRLF